VTLAFLDTETTGLDPDRHEIWELAIIYDDKELEIQLPVDLAKADPTGLRIGRFYERRTAIGGIGERVDRMCRSRWGQDKKFEGGLGVAEWHAPLVAQILDGRHIVGAVPSFDAAFLTRWLNRHGQAATWHYHLVDVEALAAGHAQTEPPWNSHDLSSWVGVNPDDFDRHTALSDARWAKAIYDAVMTPPARDGTNQQETP
jgi:oligoribonuclease (3'-5' exoribonuclease)